MPVIVSNFINVRTAIAHTVLVKMIAASFVVMGMCCAVKLIKTSPLKRATEAGFDFQYS